MPSCGGAIIPGLGRKVGRWLEKVMWLQLQAGS
jgi:hypothetical protein